VDRVTSTSPESVVIVMILFNLQCWRRLYECLYVNVDTGSKMNILHYIVGFVHYFCSGLGYLSEAPGFASLHSGQLLSIKKNEKIFSGGPGGLHHAPVAMYRMAHKVIALGANKKTFLINAEI
jgi:hypothetical protein